MSLSPPPPASVTEPRPVRRQFRRANRTRRMTTGSSGSSAPAARKLSLLILFGIAQGLFLFSPLFRLAEIDVQGLDRLSRPAVIRQASLAPGSYLWALSPRGISERLRSLPEVQTASVRMAVPGKVTLAIRERQPVALLSRAGGPSVTYEVDAEGVILGRVRQRGKLPNLRVEHPVPASGRIDPTPILIAMKARTWVEANLRTPVLAYEIDDLQTVTVSTRFLNTPLSIRMGTLQNMDYKMHILRAIMERLEKEKRPALTIDLRFSSPVVRPLKPDPEPTESVVGSQ